MAILAVTFKNGKERAQAWVSGFFFCRCRGVRAIDWRPLIDHLAGAQYF